MNSRQNVSCTIITIVLHLFSIFTSGQTSMFNKILILTGDSADERLYSIVKHNQRIFIAGAILEENDKVVVAEIDSLGNVVWVKTYGGPGHRYWFGFRQGLAVTTDEHLVAVGSYLPDSGYSRFLMMKLTMAGDTLWSRILLQDEYLDQFCNGYGVIPVSDGGFAVLGEIGIMSVLIKTDSLGNTLWKRTFGVNQTTQYMYLRSVRESPDKGFLLGGSFFNGHQTNSGASIIYSVDSVGEIRWLRTFGGPYRDGDAYPFVNSDTDLVILSATSTAPNYAAGRLHLIRLNSDGTTVSEQQYGLPNHFYFPQDIRKLSDSTFIACGYYNYQMQGWLFNFTVGGDSLFLRNYTLTPPGNPYIISRRFHGCITTPDGGVLTLGEIDYPIGSTGQGDGWLVKTDRFGCLEPACDPYAIYILQHPRSDTACRHITVEFAVHVSGDSINFTWQSFQDGQWANLPDSLPYQGIHDSILQVVTFEVPFSEMTFRCKVWNQVYDIPSLPCTLTLYDPVNILQQPADQIVRLNDTATFKVSTCGTPTLAFQWFKSGNLIGGSTDSLLIIYPVYFTDTGHYYCRIENACGHITSETALLKINTLSIEVQDKNNLFRCYPNPSSEILFLEPIQPVTGEMVILILDSSGKVVIQMKPVLRENRHLISIPISGLPAGLYTMIIEYDGKHTHLPCIFR
ncbi:MAG: immunoglobulin domain-containing protein [bacterium]